MVCPATEVERTQPQRVECTKHIVQSDSQAEGKFPSAFLLPNTIKTEGHRYNSKNTNDMDTTTFNSSMVNNLWNVIQGLSLSSTDQRWLADRLFESAKADDIAILAQARKAIDEMRQQSEENGNSEMTLEEINAEIRAARHARK